MLLAVLLTAQARDPQVRIDAAWRALQRAEPDEATALVAPLLRRRPPTEALVVSAIADVQRCALDAAAQTARQAAAELTPASDPLLWDLNERALIEALAGQTDCVVEWSDGSLPQLQEAIDLLWSRLRRLRPVGEERAELLLRLADLYEQVSMALWLAEVEALDEGCGFAEGTWRSPSRYWEVAAIALYHRVGEVHPETDAGRQAVYLEALLRRREGDGEEAALRRALRADPDSPMAAEALTGLGEELFHQGRFFEAEAVYLDGLDAATDGLRRDYLIYKLAWCRFLTGRYDEAVTTMMPVTRAVHELPFLREEALRDVVRFHVLYDNPEAAQALIDGVEVGLRPVLRRMLEP